MLFNTSGFYVYMIIIFRQQSLTYAYVCTVCVGEKPCRTSVGSECYGFMVIELYPTPLQFILHF